ncbi:MAG: hypothetical protein ABSH28_20925 [Acidobacteriota bacterium]|jgi:hypothetical protein
MKRSHLVLIAIVIAVVALGVLIRGWGDPAAKHPVQEPLPAPFPPGTQARLIYQDMEKMPVYVDEACFWNAQSAIKRNDKTELSRIIIDGEVEMLPAGTVVTVRSYDPRGVSEIELEDKGHRWIANKLLHK